MSKTVAKYSGTTKKQKKFFENLIWKTDKFQISNHSNREKLNRYDFEQNNGTENPKKTKSNNLRKILKFSIISELSNETENLKRLISTNRQIF